MNVGQMKEALSHYPDDADVGVYVSGTVQGVKVSGVTPVTDTSRPAWGVSLHVQPLTDEYHFHPALVDSGDTNRG